MKTNHSPAQILSRERSRKSRYREGLYREGWRQHTLWTTDDGWKDILELVKISGPDKVRGAVAGAGSEVRANGLTEAVMDGSGATPPYQIGALGKASCKGWTSCACSTVPPPIKLAR